ncbi:MAG: hypothetical protein MJY95_08270 [Bacteroidaceae bacterium]|nr:hypothetical protein [Bacteroidaceae bacterium]
MRIFTETISDEDSEMINQLVLDITNEFFQSDEAEEEFMEWKRERSVKK